MHTGPRPGHRGKEPLVVMPDSEGFGWHSCPTGCELWDESERHGETRVFP